ncbi:hypothetical protein ABT034_07240 [Streptomyces sp. NPDC002773]|uniref:DUF6924 domain-containing protein n=1 Tax=Streptomyces sp. NPDC002773 TaxID=3154430 RepID=UPI00331D7696
MTMPEGLERVLPEIVGRDMFDALVIRTDFSDDESWNAVVRELRQAWGPDDEFPASVQVVDAPAWSGATADEVLVAVDEDKYLNVVFLADRHTMQSPARALLALTRSGRTRATSIPSTTKSSSSRRSPGSSEPRPLRCTRSMRT